MIIYIIVKIMLSYFLIIKKQWIKETWKLDIGIDLLVVCIFIYLMRISEIEIEKTLWIVLVGSMMIGIFLGFKMLNKVLEKKEKIIEWVEKREKVKMFLLRPEVNKIIYYGVWMLPWNIVYWIYFWIVENGWYIRVWYSSNRDIFFWRYFKWDSRDFFGAIRRYDIIMVWIRVRITDRIYKGLCRIMIIVYLIRERMKEMKVSKYIWIRMVVYMYLSVFYLYFTVYLHIINYYLLIIIIIIEMIGLLFLEEIVVYIERRYEIDAAYYSKLIEKGIITLEFAEIRDKMLYPLVTDTRMKWELNVYVWDKTLSNSITLNMLYTYMIWVNKKTEGYYDRQMNIRSRVHRKKFIEEKSIIWDVLPRTRYVIIALKYFGYEQSSINIANDINVGIEYKINNLCIDKKFYLGYYEKAYSNTSLLMFLWMMRVNKSYWGIFELRGKISDKDLEEFYSFKKNEGIHIYDYMTLVYFVKDKRFMNEIILFSYILSQWIHYYTDADYMYYYKDRLVEKRKEIEIPKEFCSIKEYRMIFKIMGRIQLYEEEGIVWNEKLQELLKEKEKKEEEEYKNVEEGYRYYKFITGNNVVDFAIGQENYINGSVLSYMKGFYKRTEPELEEIIGCIKENNAIGIALMDIKVKETRIDEIKEEEILFRIFHMLIIWHVGNINHFMKDLDSVFEYYSKPENMLKEYKIDCYEIEFKDEEK